MLRVAQGWCHDKVSRPVIALLYVAVLRLVIRCSSCGLTPSGFHAYLLHGWRGRVAVTRSATHVVKSYICVSAAESALQASVTNLRTYVDA